MFETFMQYVYALIFLEFSRLKIFHDLTRNYVLCYKFFR